VVGFARPIAGVLERMRQHMVGRSRRAVKTTTAVDVPPPFFELLEMRFPSEQRLALLTYVVVAVVALLHS
jgi:hypothetical protein